MAPRFTWETEPAGIEITGPQWPAPAVFAADGLVSYGYEDQVLLPFRVRLPDTLPPGQTVILRGRVQWLVCHEVCAAVDSELELALPVASAAAPTSSAAADLLAATATRLPRPLPADWAAEALPLRRGVQVRIHTPASAPAAERDLARARLFPLDGERFAATAATAWRRDRDGHVSTFLPLAAGQSLPARLQAVLTVPGRAGDGQEGVFEIDCAVSAP
jgi:DsbC/DsbD-like thiol-disulfide interchange protein